VDFTAIFSALAAFFDPIGATLEPIIDSIDEFVWGPAIIILLVGSHIFLTIRTGFIQRKLPTAIKLSVTKDPEAEGDVSQFGALTTALSATIGTGNIVGVATAIFAGGPGAVFWLWIIGVFGIATKYAETYVAVKYRVKDHKGNMLGGAMYAWKRHFEKNGKTPWWAALFAGLFALFAALASFGIGSAVQANAITDIITRNFPAIPSFAVGLVIVILVSLVIFGGIKIIARVCEILVPFMAVFYVVGCIVILIINAPFILPALQNIVLMAFSLESGPQAAFGGAVGGGLMAAMRFGAARGLFSNESGLGSAPIVASAAATRNPARQSLVSMTGTFWDTVIVCAITGIVLVSTLLAQDGLQQNILLGKEAIANPSQYAEIPSQLITNGAGLTNAAFNTIPFIGQWILIIGLATFALSTILGWSYYGNRCVTYLLGKKALIPYQIIYVVVAFLGAIGIGGMVWSISDITNALMAIPNIIVVLLLSGLVAKETKHFVFDGNLNEKIEEEIPVHADK
jgi:AGCS family alanine or glycine:cation symporter